MIGEGGRVLATDRAGSIDRIRDLIGSILVKDGTRSICLMHCGYAQPNAVGARRYTDYAVLMDDRSSLNSMAGVRLLPTSPCWWATSVDTEGLLLKCGLNAHWTLVRPDAIASTGSRHTHRQFRKANVTKRLRQKGASTLGKMNSGVSRINSIEAERILAGQDDYSRCWKACGVGLHNGRPAQTLGVNAVLWVSLNEADCSSRVAENIRRIVHLASISEAAQPEATRPGTGHGPGLHGAAECGVVAITVGVVAPRRTSVADAGATWVRTADKTPDKPRAAGTTGCTRRGGRQPQSRPGLGHLFRRDAAAWPDFPMIAVVAFR